MANLSFLNNHSISYEESYYGIVDGDYYYLASKGSNKFLIYNISNPSSIFKASDTNITAPVGIYKDGNYCYISSGSYPNARLDIYNVSNPSSPTPMGNVTHEYLHSPRGTIKVGNYVYVCSSIYDSVSVINVANPNSPFFVTYLAGVFGNEPNSICGEGNYLYVQSMSKFCIINITNPASPSLASSLTSTNVRGTWYTGNKLFLEGNYVYVAADHSSPHSLAVVDVTNKNAPVVKDTIYDAGSPPALPELSNPGGIVKVGNYAFVLTGAPGGLAKVDVLDVNNLIFIEHLDDDSKMHFANALSNKWNLFFSSGEISGAGSYINIIQDYSITRLIPPSTIDITSEPEKNILTWDYCPNEYFNDLENWTFTYSASGSTMVLELGKIKIDIPDGEDGFALAQYIYNIFNGDFTIHIDLDNYTPDNTTDGLWVALRLTSLSNVDIFNLRYRQAGASSHLVRLAYKINGGSMQYSTPSWPTNRLTKFKIIREGNYLKAYYYDNGWTLHDSVDFGSTALDIKRIGLYVDDYNERGGSVKFDNLIIVSKEECFFNEYFNNLLDRWETILTNGGTAVIDSGKVLLDVPDGVDAEAKIDYKYSIPLGDFVYDIDMGDYQKDVAVGPVAQFISDSALETTGNNYAFIRIYDNTGTWKINYLYNINGSTGSIGWADIAGKPSKLRIIREGDYLKTYYYISSWVLIGSIDFGVYASEISIVKLSLVDLSEHGGSVEYDNLILVDKGIESFNLYWKKDKFPNEYFNNLDRWIITKKDGSETVELVNGQLRIILPDIDSEGKLKIENFPFISSGDFEAQIDLVDYNPNDSDNGPHTYFALRSDDDQNIVYLYYRSKATGTGHHCRMMYVINGGELQYKDIVEPNSIPIKLKIVRFGNNLKALVYVGSSWILLGEVDFGSYASEIDRISIYSQDTNLNGGNIIFDNLIITPSVKDSGTKIPNILDLTYDHESLEAEHVYCYEVTAEGSESEPSEEVYGIPEVGVPNAPSGISVDGGEEQNTINFTVDPEADKTHIYWANSPGVTPGTGTKIADVTSPHIHDDLNPSLTYYYVLTSENEKGEGDPSIEYNSSPIPEPPENIAVVAGIEKNTITWDPALGADTYNIYWKNTSGVTKATGTKITGVTSPYEHLDLMPGLPYYYVVTSEDEDGESSISSEVNDTPHLAVPINPNAVLSDALEITVTWDAVTGATKYNIYWLKTPGVTKGTGNKIGDESSPYKHIDLDDGDTYYYVITAENAYEEGGESDEVNVVVEDIPDAPLGVSAVATDIQEITVSWSSVPDVESYNIYWDTLTGVNKINSTKIEEVISPHVFNAPIPDINYFFIITSVDSVTGESDESDEVYALSIPPVPNAPLDVLATPGEAKITIDFTVAPYADEHHIYWKDTPGVTKANGIKIENVTKPHDFVVPALYQTYYFIITAENESGEGDESSEVNAIPIPIIPDSPINVEGVPTASNELTISWDAVTYAVTYNVYYARLPNVSKVTATKISGVSDVSRVIGNLISGRFYYFAIASVNPEGESDLSSEAYARVVNSLSGKKIFYINAEAKHNNIIVIWSDLEDADTYNLYWSKTTPLDIGTANKIENVISPYRHYRTSTDDPYYVITGENSLGESDPSSEVYAAPKDIKFRSINFLPENLREYPLFQEFCSILDYVVDKYHYENIDKLTGLYNAVHDDFDPDYVLKLIGSDYFFEFDLTTDQKRSLCLLLSNLYDMKGTKKGLDYVLRLIGLEAQVYEWYNINKGMYPEIPETVDPCSIVIDLGLGDHSLLEDEEQKFINLAGYLLWVCVKLHGIFWSKKFEDWFEGIEDDLHTIELDNVEYNKFCSWKYNYPEVVVIGFPFELNYCIGEPGMVIGATYYEGYPFVILPDVEDGIDFDGVCDAHYIGEPDIYISDGGAGEGLSQLTWIIEEDP